ncbi:MAG: hypothetical protein AAGD05_02685, partial [Bacteroidota bacterium]
MQKLGNYVLGQWTEGDGTGSPLYNSVNGEIVAMATTKGLDFGAILSYGRKKGGPPLRKMTFQQRGNMLKKLALYLTKRKEQFYEVSYKTGATRADSWIDIEGGFGNLFANASLRRNFPNQSFHVDGNAIDLSRGGQFMGHHIGLHRVANGELTALAQIGPANPRELAAVVSTDELLRPVVE